MGGFFDGAKTAVSGNDKYVAMPRSLDLASLDGSYTTVMDNEVNRPDKIALRAYGDENLDWVVDEANGFSHGFSEYSLGRRIFLPDRGELVRAGAI